MEGLHLCSCSGSATGRDNVSGHAAVGYLELCLSAHPPKQKLDPPKQKLEHDEKGS
jgi:hypothetical protein